MNKNVSVRHLDALGRITIPSDIRKSLFIGEDCDLMITTDGDRIIIEKMQTENLILNNISEVKAFVMENMKDIGFSDAKMLLNYIGSIERMLAL